METQYTLFNDSDFGYTPKVEKPVVTTTQKVVDVKVAQSSRFTASMLQALVDGGIFTEGEGVNVEDIYVEYGHANGIVLPHLAGIEEEREYDCQMEELRHIFEEGTEQILEAMENLHEVSEKGFFSPAEYAEEVCYYYSINATCKGIKPISYHDFMLACRNFITESSTYNLR